MIEQLILSFCKKNTELYSLELVEDLRSCTSILKVRPIYCFVIGLVYYFADWLPWLAD